ncbi:Wadjet anti-phage system protein JetD domain-containing protein [Acetivibrio cellulolyticus]|uniref:Wadjet anti-phage system protein JetD domain-containing protein n=1 Tax=Acetivibrio cellulolyticus TaxID=35830 RepID=UPI0001E2D922|nr:Wadjet anti-phage system protein JetD domain-containing protein [Acetivibrio cellulolyticus]
MEKFIYKIIESQSKKVIEIADILISVERKLGGDDFEIKGGYRTFADIIKEFCEKGILIPVKVSGTNGRNPSLHNKYRISYEDKKQLEDGLFHELQSLHPKLDKSYYFKNPDVYREDRNYVLMLSEFLLKHFESKSLKFRCTMNERSFEIFNNEKFLESRGKVLLKRLGLSFNDLNCYKTLEAFFYILFKPQASLTILIIENKDTFYSVLKYLERRPDKDLFGINIDMLIYGEGKKIVNSYSFINEVATGMPIDRVYYFGDLDFEGIGIFNSMAAKYGKYLIVPHVNLYKQMLAEAKNPPFLRTNQSELNLELFLMNFDEESKTKISEILYTGRYIPQEAVNFGRKKNL